MWFIIDEKAEMQKCNAVVVLVGRNHLVHNPVLWMNDIRVIETTFILRRVSFFNTRFISSVPPLSEKKSSTILSCGANLKSSMWPWASSSSRTRTGPSSGPGCWRSCGNAKTSSTGDSTGNTKQLNTWTGQWHHVKLRYWIKKAKSVQNYFFFYI